MGPWGLEMSVSPLVRMVVVKVDILVLRLWDVARVWVGGRADSRRVDRAPRGVGGESRSRAPSRRGRRLRGGLDQEEGLAPWLEARKWNIVNIGDGRDGRQARWTSPGNFSWAYPVRSVGNKSA